MQRDLYQYIEKNMTYSIAILGASGYTGAELIRLISEHPSMKIKVKAKNTETILFIRNHK